MSTTSLEHNLASCGLGVASDGDNVSATGLLDLGGLSGGGECVEHTTINVADQDALGETCSGGSTHSDVTL